MPLKVIFGKELSFYETTIIMRCRADFDGVRLLGAGKVFHLERTGAGRKGRQQKPDASALSAGKEDDRRLPDYLPRRVL